MQEQTSQHPDNTAAVSEFRVRLGRTTELTQGSGSGSGSSEDKRYVYN